MHIEKIKIFDEYAQTQGFKSWEDLKLTQDLDLMSSEEFDVHVFAACDLVQKEQQKRIAEKVPYDSIDEKMILENIIVNEQNLIK